MRGSVPLGLTINQVSSSIHTFAPSIVSTFFGVPWLMHAWMTLSTTSLEGHENFVLYWNVCGSSAICWEKGLLSEEDEEAASMSSTSAVAIAPSLTSLSAPYMN